MTERTGSHRTGDKWNDEMVLEEVHEMTAMTD
jgi:hypothetical protein